ncbi:MAG: ABC transporter ATP-binding protein [Rhodobacter sp.]|nr:ABC transporter ATP-binding protein [Rhodobacter sp.]
MTQMATLDVRGLRVGFSTPGGLVVAVEDMSLSVSRGEVLAIIGESGSGKTVTAMAIARLIASPPARYLGGSVRLGGDEILTLDERAMEQVRGRRIATIFQNPRASLDPSFTVQAQLTETLRRHDPTLDRAGAEAVAVEALREVGFPDADRVMASYPHQLSGGMCQRIALAMALACKPEVLIADEPTTALDVGVQARILLLLLRRSRDTGLPVILITHDIGVVAAMASRVLVMYGGHMQEEAPVGDLMDGPLHPYTRALIAAIPDPDAPPGERSFIDGEPPDLFDPPPGCRFAPRCPLAEPRCHTDLPAWRSVAAGRSVRCHLA